MDPASVVRTFHERMEARDWSGASELLSPTVHIEYTETGECFDGSNFLAMNHAYPDGWAIEVVETVAAGDRVASQVSVRQGDDVFWCAGFYTVADGVIMSGIEHWVTEGEQAPPEWRRQFTTP
jgi:SnoaL-like domain